MKKFLITAAVAGLAALAFAGTASAVDHLQPCGGHGYSRTWAGRHTSCAMAKATSAKVMSVASATGETPGAVYVRSPVTHRTYRMHLTSVAYHTSNGEQVAKWTGRGDFGSQITVYFWIP